VIPGFENAGTRAIDSFGEQFATLVGPKPFRWQQRLFEDFLKGLVPASVDLPTGLGKTSVMAVWLIARARGANLPRRLVYVVDRRVVVDQATDEAEKLRDALEGRAKHFEALDGTARTQAVRTAAELKTSLGFAEGRGLPISTLRGAHVDNREWLDDPAAPAIVVGTVDMIGSRLLFEGYGVSRKMRPYQAGLLGVDALVVLDEAHLVPPFAHLLRAIEQDASLHPSEEADRSLLPRFVLLPLSATQRDPGAGGHGRVPFRLADEDWATDDVARGRLEAKKRLRLEPLAEKNPDRQIAEAAWALAEKDGKFFRVVVFCDRREKKEDGGGPSAEGVFKAIKDLAVGDRKAGRAGRDLHPVELLVGARRVREREKVAMTLRALGFVGEKEPLGKPAFLVATSAGEVGADIDADHMVSDLVTWERMVQRLGRVNRRGEGDAEVRVFWREPPIKNADAPTQREKRALIAFAARVVVENLPEIDGAHDASPGALLRLAESARKDAALGRRISAATAPEPLRPALNRALVDAWSMTSLETHTGRPDVAPWLRGWVEEAPQTTVVWRRHLPIRLDADGQSAFPSKAEIEDFFEAARLRESEKLDTETYRVAAWLQGRAGALLGGKRPSPGEAIGDGDTGAEASAAEDADAEEPAGGTSVRRPDLRREDIAALVLSSSGAFAGGHTLRDLARERKGKANGEFHAELAGKILVFDARFGGLKDGLLDGAGEDLPETVDGTESWSKEAGVRVLRVNRALAAEPLAARREDGWRFEDDFDLRRSDEGTPLEQLVVEHLRDSAQGEDARSISEPQELGAHQCWARAEMMRIAKAVGLSGDAAGSLAIGAGLHDEGKKAPRWQRAFKAPRDAQKFGLSCPLAKTRGPICQAILGRYRHEFGSLPCVEEDPEFKALPDDWQELVLHLVAAHHGQARPVIETRGCEDGLPSSLEERACAVALRFARLQRRWGPWGLAWWEALMRAADRQASRRLEGQG